MKVQAKIDINRGNDYLPLIKNVLYLGSTQLVNFISPLLLTPFLLRTIGIEKFGVVVLAQTTMNFVLILTEYGFNLTSTQVASTNRNNKVFLSKLYNEVFTTRSILIIVGFILICITTFIFPIFIIYRKLFIFSYFIVAGRSMLPYWFFLGVEKMKFIAYLNMCARIFTYLFIFLLVKEPGDYLYINIIWGSSEIVIGLFCIYYLKKKFDINTSIHFDWNSIGKQLSEGWSVFTINGLNAVYTNSSILVLSIFATEQVLGIYAVAEKIMMLLKQGFGVLTQATYPYACRLAESSTSKFKKFLKLELYLCLAIFSLSGGVVFLLSNQLIELVVGYPQPEASMILRILAFVPLIVSLNLPSYQVLLINQFKSSYLSVVSIAAVLNIIMNFILVPNLMSLGTTLSVIITELFITLGFHLILYVRHPEDRIQFV